MLARGCLSHGAAWRITISPTFTHRVGRLLIELVVVVGSGNIERKVGTDQLARMLI